MINATVRSVVHLSRSKTLFDAVLKKSGVMITARSQQASRTLSQNALSLVEFIGHPQSRL
jgi:hypothetical protein